MQRKRRSLNNLHVASPCPVKWNEMRGDNRIRHCAICSLNVYNVSAMTESEAEALLASASGRLCVQFYRRADGTVLTQDCPVGLAAVKRKMFGYAGAAAAFIFACLLLPLQPASERRHRIVVYREVKTKLVHPRPILEPAEVMIGGEANYGYDPAGTNFYVHPDGAASALGSPGHRDGRFVVIPGQTSVEISP